MRLAALALAFLCACDLGPPPSKRGTAPPPSAVTPERPERNDRPERLVQVALAGRVSLPASAPPGRLLLAISDGPCFQIGTHYLATTAPAAEGAWHLSLFAAEGTPLGICAALIEPGLRKSAWWAHPMAPLALVGHGPFRFDRLDVGIEHGVEIAIPEGLKAL